MPKTLEIAGRVLSPEQTVNFNLSRRMAVDDFTRLDARLIDNTSIQLSSAALDLYVDTEQIKKTIIEDKTRLESKIQSDFNTSLRNLNSKQTMKIPHSYLNYLANYLGTN
jgi:hypothetical protein